MLQMEDPDSHAVGDLPQDQQLLRDSLSLGMPDGQFVPHVDPFKLDFKYFQLAVTRGLDQLVEAWLGWDFEVDQADEEGWTPLHMAAFHGRSKVARLLMQGGADANKRDKQGCTPLYRAVLGGHCKVAEFLVVGGASADLADIYGQTPLSVLAQTGGMPGELEMAAILLQYGASLDRADATGQTPLTWAASKGGPFFAACLKSIDKSCKQGETPIREVPLIRMCFILLYFCIQSFILHA